LKTTIRPLLLLLMAVSCIVMLARAQDATRTSPTVAGPYEAGELRQTYGEMPAPLPNFGKSRSSWTRDKSSSWKVHLALRLVRRPELNERQVQIILDGISTEFFADANGPRAKKAKTDDAFQALRRRAFAAFRKNEAADLFVNRAGRKAEDDILKMYYDLSALPLPERRVSFRNASSNDKSELWRTHLALFLVKRPELNEWQKQIILAAMSLATPEYFDVRSSSPDWKVKVREPLRSLEQQVLMAFSFNDGAKIFATLGDDTEAVKRTPTYVGSFLLSSINYKLGDSGPTGNQFLIQDRYRDGGTCACSTDSDWCPISGYCNSTSCKPTESGCGTMWRYPCDGACR
jgi:hypothetical protein